jgi:hypothetical protein
MPPALVRGQDDSIASLRYRADSEFRVAEKAYKKATASYGESLDGLPKEEREDACRKVGWALHDNKGQYDKEDVLNQMKYKGQVEKLETYSRDLGCLP